MKTNKKGDLKLSWETLISIVLFVIVAVSLVLLFRRIYGVTVSEPDAETLNNFNRLGREINDLAKEIREQDKEQASITIPLSIKANYYVMFHSDSNQKTLPRACKKESCICLLSGKEEIIVECMQTQDVYMGSYESFPVLVNIEKPDRTLKLKLTLTARKVSKLGLYNLDAEEVK